MLELLSIYGAANDEALSVLFLLLVDTNNARSGAISSGLRRVHEADSAKFSRIADGMGLNLTEISCRLDLLNSALL